MSLKGVHSVYFIGIGGIGMSALARYFNSNHTGVSGYDRTSTTLTDNLKQEGIDIHFVDDPSVIPQSFLEVPKEQALVVFTPAIPEHHRELNFLKKEGYRLLKRSEVLAEITLEKFTIAVAGTHGKTTVTSMIAHLFMKSNVNFTAFVGGVIKNYESNYLRSEGRGNEIMVVEADEFDRSFHRLRPDIAVITSVEADHLDIYKEPKKLEDAFVEFGNKVKAGGKLLVHKDALKFFRAGNSYGTDGDYSYTVTSFEKGYSEIVFCSPEGNQALKISVSGKHNIENAVACLSVGKMVGLKDHEIQEGLKDYPGVKRRFEKILVTERLVLIDDYAHHPTELNASITAARQLYPGNFLTVLFQPHLYSRTKDFAAGFAKSLDLADEVYLMEIYPARELPIEGITSKTILDKMELKKARIIHPDEFQKVFSQKKNGVLLTLGAGDIDKSVEAIREILSRS